MSQPDTYFSFTKERLESLPLPQGKDRITYHDTHKQASGLQLRITSTGVKSYYVFGRVKGVPQRNLIGHYPKMTIEQARNNAAKINVAIADGANPAEVKRALKAELTFGDLYKDYFDRHSKPSKKTWGKDKQCYEQYLEKPLGKKKLSDVDRKAIASVFSKITIAGHPVVANRVLALISSIFGWAINAGLWDKNPAKGIKRNKEISRDRFLQSDELPRFFSALAQEENQIMTDYFLTCLLTGARRANVMSMHYKDINFERAEWRIEETKNGTSQTVTLAPQAIEILKARKPEENAGFVFPGNGESGHLVEPKKAWSRLLVRAGLNNLRIHDLRRTLGSWQAISGASLVIIGKSLNHKNVATTAIYARLDSDPVRASVNTAVSAMMNAGKVGTFTANEKTETVSTV
jgi:integrase